MDTAWLTDAKQITENYFNEWNKLLNEEDQFKTEESQKMKQCEYQIGDVFVAKNEISDVNSGQALLICPGYDKDNLEVFQGKKGVVVTVYKQCEDCGGIEGTERFYFDYNEYFEVVDVSSELINGILTIQVDYDTEGNVDIMDAYDYINMADQIENEKNAIKVDENEIKN